MCKITGFYAASLQPNSGAAGEYAGLCVIRAYHESRGEAHRDICLIPLSAHGTNPAVSPTPPSFHHIGLTSAQSAAMAGLKVVSVQVHPDGNLDLQDLKAKAEKHKDNLAAFMVRNKQKIHALALTFILSDYLPINIWRIRGWRSGCESGALSYGFSKSSFARKACQIIHDNGGQVYLDGANLNAQISLTNPATCGGDVCHMNLHKTFAMYAALFNFKFRISPFNSSVRMGEVVLVLGKFFSCVRIFTN